MRVLPLLFLAACFDGATTTVTLDVKQGVAHVVQQLHNAWPDEVGCGDDGEPPPPEVCVAGIRARLDKQRDELVEGGATVARTGVVLVDGELDLLFDYTAPVGAKTMTAQGLAFLWMEERTPAQVERGRPGRKRVAMVSIPFAGGENQVTVDGRYRALSGAFGDAPLDLWLFRGREATIVSEWTYQPGPNGAESPGAWVAERPGLAEAIRASGLVVDASGPTAR
ncbi:MAG: hypothetical protein ACK4YP_09385 [Myxococcota bacterium]